MSSAHGYELLAELAASSTLAMHVAGTRGVCTYIWESRRAGHVNGGSECRGYAALAHFGAQRPFGARFTCALALCVNWLCGVAMVCMRVPITRASFAMPAFEAKSEWIVSRSAFDGVPG